MVKYPDQGAKILYSGIVDKWFDKSGMSLRAEEIKEVTAQYAKDKQAGYYTAIYKLDPVRPWTSKGGKACTNTEEIAQTLLSESAYYMEDLKKPNARLYLYLKAVEGANGAEVSVTFQKYFTEYNSQYALSLICLQLQDNCLTIGSKKYASPEELTQEKDSTQIDLIKKDVMKTDSTLLVWLSFFYKDKLESANEFSKQTATGQFFLLGLLPYLSVKEFDSGWQQNAAKILLGFINDSPGRADLFETYATRGLPLNDPLDKDLYSPPIEFIVRNFNEMSEKHSKDTILNLIRLLVKCGADVNVVSKVGFFPLLVAYDANRWWKQDPNLFELLVELGAKVNGSSENFLLAANENNILLLKLMIKQGIKKNARNTAYNEYRKRPSKFQDKEVLRLLAPTGITNFRDTIDNLYGNMLHGNIGDKLFVNIYSILCTVGIALGSWALLERVFGLGSKKNILVFIVLVVVGFFLVFAFLFNKKNLKAENYPVKKLFAVLLLAIAGVVGFFVIPKLM
jgi:hypothetical protein